MTSVDVTIVVKWTCVIDYTYSIIIIRPASIMPAYFLA